MRSRVKKLSTGGGGVGAGGNGGTILIMSWKCTFSFYLDIQAITTLYASIGYLCVASFCLSFFYLTTTLLKSDIFRHSNVFPSYSFQPTGIELGSL